MRSADLDTTRFRLGRSIVLLTIAFALGIGFMIWRVGAERRALLHMPNAERADLFGRSHAAFRIGCLPRPPHGLEARCRSMAEFLRDFPECGAECHRDLEAVLPSSTR